MSSDGYNHDICSSCCFSVVVLLAFSGGGSGLVMLRKNSLDLSGVDVVIEKLLERCESYFPEADYLHVSSVSGCVGDTLL